MYKPQQGDIIWLNFSPSIGKEMRGSHPAVVVSSNQYNQKTNYLIVCPITTGGNHFQGYIELKGYAVHGRINATQIHSFDSARMQNTQFIDRLRGEDFLMVKQVLDYALQLDF
ncbi:MAG: type II toxin-antitoxin system PemK/MazF family toxin [Streptococcaceae bacterium]|jgi:mRNA interferase MazF|nr:type II toxin-antitoxin system PemK/MazF family toxin [Streptococcaceae bacterium]MCH4177619.1 type II toxin-antitoxin system PemK/MazF family toxin [Streptococcaceae bacterium]